MNDQPNTHPLGNPYESLCDEHRFDTKEPKLGVVVYSFNPSTQQSPELKTGMVSVVRSRPAKDMDIYIYICMSSI